MPRGSFGLSVMTLNIIPRPIQIVNTFFNKIPSYFQDKKSRSGKTNNKQCEVILLAKKQNKSTVQKRSESQAFLTQPISQADKRQDGTAVALPNEANVKRNKNWVDENEK